MRKLWLIAITTYRKRVRSGRFLLLTLGLPLLMVIAGAVPILTASNGADVPAAIGFVDQAGQLAPVHEVAIEEALLDIDQRLLFTPYASPETAAHAVQAGEIGGYLLIPEDYFQGAAVSYVAPAAPDAVVEEGLMLFLQRALLGQQPEWVFQRLQDPAHYAYAGLTSGETVAEGPGLLIRLLAPIALAIVFALAVFLGAGQMGSAIIREKESRAMEMVITSLPPRELVAGKVLGMTLLSLTQFVIWTVGALVAATLAFGRDVELASLAIPWSTLLWGLALIIPAYFLFALLAAGVGIIAGGNQQAQQLAGLIGLFGLAPIWVLAPILSAPAGTVSVALTLFPLTAPTVAMIRSVFGTVPVWQLEASLAILLLSLAFAIWFVAKIFRAAMLNYGQTLQPRQVWQVLTEA